MKSFFIFSGLYGITAAILKLAGFVLFIWIAKILTVDEFAQFGILLAIQQGLVVFGNAGVIETTIGKLKDIQSSYDKEHLYKSSLMAFILLTIGASIIVGFSIFSLTKQSESFHTYVVVILSGALLGLVSFKSQLYRIDEIHSRALLYSFIPALGGVVGSGICVFIFATTSSFFYGTVLGVFIPLLFLEKKFRSPEKVFFNKSESFNILIKAIPYLAIAIMSWLSGYGNNYIIDEFFTSGEVAKFTFLLSLCSIMLMLASALNQVWGPRFFKLIFRMPFTEVENRSKTFYYILNHLLGILGGFVVIMYPFFITLVGGNVLFYYDMTLELSLMFSAYIFTTPWWHCYNHFLSQGLGSSLLKISLITSSIGLFSTIMLMWLLGPIGIFIGFSVQILIRSIGILYFSKRKWEIDISLIGIIIGLGLIFIGYFISIADLGFSLSIVVFVIFAIISLLFNYKKYKQIFSQTS